jgi:hypothetical protein
MKRRSSFEICLPAATFALAAIASLPVFIFSLVWLMIGLCSIGYLTLNDLPMAGIARKWRRGPLSVVLWIYHLSWWPWHMRVELRMAVAHVSAVIRRKRAR